MATCSTVFQGEASGATLTSGTLVPAANRVYLLAITAYRTNTNPAVPTSVSLWGLTWTLRGNTVYDDSSGSRRALFVYTAKTGDSPSSGALSISIASVEQIAATLDTIEEAIDGSIVQAKTATDTGSPTSLTCTLDASAQASSVMWSAHGWGGYADSRPQVSTSGFAQVSQAEVDDDITTTTAFHDGPANAVQWSATDFGGPMGIVLLEINATEASAGGGAARRRRLLCGA